MSNAQPVEQSPVEDIQPRGSGKVALTIRGSSGKKSVVIVSRLE